ncbi:hypothetical protein [Gottfriedia solisilvae]|uniref:Uncharacterized protein n=1 Tax=Gottfriedia solisilvae TaxID=1516104 RepID=A0A8J3F1G9_9BACI|nr:hypothetical protein [Gottfriedia solisilvae]GGI16576.1 hypothetical protein GCM10007380_33650 [Gottfriedia solisilvae]
MRNYEKEFTSIGLEDYDFKLIEKFHSLNFKVIGNFSVYNGKVIVIEKFLYSLGCKLVSTIVITAQKNLTKVNVVTAGGKVGEFLDLGANKNTHNEVIMNIEEIFREEIL